MPVAPELLAPARRGDLPQHQPRRLRGHHLPAGRPGDLPRRHAPRRERRGDEGRPAWRSRPRRSPPLIALLRRLGRPTTRVVAYAWHPLRGLGDRRQRPRRHRHVRAADGRPAAVPARPHPARRRRRHARRPAQADRAAGASRVLAPVGLAAAARRRCSPPLLAYVPYLSVGSGVLGYLRGYVERGEARRRVAGSACCG